jgi:hypothetical protein
MIEHNITHTRVTREAMLWNNEHAVFIEADEQLVFIVAAESLNRIEWMTTQNNRKNKTYKTLQLSIL